MLLGEVYDALVRPSEYAGELSDEKCRHVAVRHGQLPNQFQRYLRYCCGVESYACGLVSLIGEEGTVCEKLVGLDDTEQLSALGVAVAVLVYLGFSAYDKHHVGGKLAVMVYLLSFLIGVYVKAVAQGLLLVLRQTAP